MELACLIGLCSAAAQAVSAAGASAASAAAAAPASAASGAAAGMLEEIGWVATFVGVLSVILAQTFAPTVIRRCGQRLEALMRASSPRAAGPAGAAPATVWTADALLAGMERKRRTVLWLLVGVVLVYSLVAAFVLIAYTQVPGTRVSKLSVAVSFVMFASFCGPVVLLGVSAANFGKLFWTWFAPATFAAVAMQAMLASVSDPAEQRSQVLWALLAVGLLTAGGVALRRLVPRPLQQRARLWLKQIGRAHV